MFKELPKNYNEKLEKIFSKDELKIIKSGYTCPKRHVSFRVNTLKATNEEIESVLKEKNIAFEKVSYLSNGYILKNWIERDLWDLKIFTQGKIYLQGITSQLIGEVLKSEISSTDIKVLDLTAAPGGKTSHISALLQNNGEIIANELNAIRLDKLNFTIKRQWCTNVQVIKGDARNLPNTFEKWYFDIIIADLPCSAEGRVNASNEKSYAFLAKDGVNTQNYKIQKDILKNTVELLKDWGILLYSTCTLDPRENEGIVHFLLSNFKSLKIESLWNLFENPNISKYVRNGLKSFETYIYNSSVLEARRILPSPKTEWFFIAKFRKHDLTWNI